MSVILSGCGWTKTVVLDDDQDVNVDDLIPEGAVAVRVEFVATVE